jgi:hypothetical protein
MPETRSSGGREGERADKRRAPSVRGDEMMLREGLRSGEAACP